MFQDLGYFKEYYVNNKYIGQAQSDKDRETVGYNGRLEEILSETLIFKNGKKIKQGTKAMTILYPMCGKSE